MYISIAGYNMKSKNPLGAGNQQERLDLAWWIVGFTDGEGCFSISIFKNQTNRLGWQVMPEFVLTQGASSLVALQQVQAYFACGKIFINTRTDNHHEHLYRYCVRRRNDLETKIIPFFESFPLQTNKRISFERFRLVVALMKNNHHLTTMGLHEIAYKVGKKID